MRCILNHKLFKSLFIFSLFTASVPLWGEKQTFPSKELHSIVIKAVHLNLKVKHSPSALYTIQWNRDLSLQTKKGVLTIKSNDFNSKKWQNLQSQTAPSLEISGPSLPIQLFSFFSESSFSLWTQPVFISSFKGNIRSSRTKGPWEISLKEGSVNIQQQTGPLSVQGFHVNLSLSSSQGRFQFHINEGRLKVNKSKGELHFITDKADIQLAQFKGSLKGSSQSGTITASIQPDTVDLFSEKSPLRLSFMGQAPTITAYTEKGKIYGARHLNKQFSGNSTKVSGRIRGSVKKGTVSVKTGTGNIYIN